MIVATFNRQNILSASIRSILNQTFTDFELIIIDDCSTDNTWDVLEKVAVTDTRIRLLQTPNNCGCNLARNFAIKQAKGKYIAIMDDDDISLPIRLESQVDFLDQNTQYGIIGSTVKYIVENDLLNTTVPPRQVAKQVPDDSISLFKQIYLSKYIVPNTTLMFCSEVIKKHGYPLVRYNGADVTLILQLAALGIKIHLIPEPLVLMRRGASHKQMTLKLNRIHLGRRRRIRDISNWLENHNIDRFNHLYSVAKKNVTVKHFIETAARKKNVTGLLIYFKALALNPTFTLSATSNLIRRKLAGVEKNWLVDFDSVSH